MKDLKSQHIHAARVEAGKDLLLELEHIVASKGISSGFFQIIGGLKEATLGIFIDGKYKHSTYAGPMEIASGLGNITIKEGKPFVHCHLVLSNQDGNAFGGHMHEGCIVSPMAEVFITSVSPNIERKLDPATKLFLMDV